MRTTKGVAVAAAHRLIGAVTLVNYRLSIGESAVLHDEVLGAVHDLEGVMAGLPYRSKTYTVILGDVVEGSANYHMVEVRLYLERIAEYLDAKRYDLVVNRVFDGESCLNLALKYRLLGFACDVNPYHLEHDCPDAETENMLDKLYGMVRPHLDEEGRGRLLANYEKFINAASAAALDASFGTARIREGVVASMVERNAYWLMRDIANMRAAYWLRNNTALDRLRDPIAMGFSSLEKLTEREKVAS